MNLADLINNYLEDKLIDGVLQKTPLDFALDLHDVSPRLHIGGVRSIGIDVKQDEMLRRFVKDNKLELDSESKKYLVQRIQKYFMNSNQEFQQECNLTIVNILIQDHILLIFNNPI